MGSEQLKYFLTGQHLKKVQPQIQHSQSSAESQGGAEIFLTGRTSKQSKESPTTKTKNRMKIADRVNLIIFVQEK